ncbi:hypothetical protein [Micromonospora sp. WMMD737]|uniref:hypothetical protein n=1 Tax=Micromonospora sp. WMMD737 TaxID=3404113 RepID=UPI003B956EAD
MAWPDDGELPVKVEAAFGADLTANPATWVWTDLSGRLLASPITMRTGKAAGSRQTSPGSCAVALANDDAALTPRHPLSPYWPDVEMGTPLRVSVQWAGVWHERFGGYADQWEPTYLPVSGVKQMTSTVRVTASGILRRFQQGAQPAKSAMRRAIEASGPVAYWPAEDGRAASQAGASVTGSSPLRVTGSVEFKPVEDYVTFAGNTIRFGTTALADLGAGGQLSARLPDAAVSATSAGSWTVHVAMDTAILSTLSGDVVVAEWTTTAGTYTRWQIRVTTTSRTQVVAYTPNGAATTLIDHGSATAAFSHYAVAASRSGGIVTLWLDIGLLAPLTTSFAGSLGGVTAVTINATSTRSNAEMPAGHIAVWAVAPIPIRTISVQESDGTFVAEARRSFNLESATGRLARLVAEDGITLDMAPVDADSLSRMGWQGPGNRLDLYRECEDVDGGVLHESGFGLGYLPRSARYNAPVALTVDLATYRVSANNRDVLTPTYDDQQLRNEWTAERKDGSFAVASDPASQRRGVYDDSIELNVASDEQLPDQASWRVHLDSRMELREAAMPLDLTANPGLAAGWLTCGIGSRIVWTNPPAQHPPGPIDRLVEGWTETISPRSWSVQIVQAPATPWDVAVAGGTRRAPADSSTLASPISATATTLIIASPSDEPWTTDPADFPLDVVVGGEHVRLSAITGTSSPWVAAVAARGLHGAQRAWPAGTSIDVALPAVAAL